MKELGFKYGYLTTYEETVFFKQEQYTFKGEMAKVNDLGKSSCRFSLPILLLEAPVSERNEVA